MTTEKVANKTTSSFWVFVPLLFLWAYPLYNKGLYIPTINLHLGAFEFLQFVHVFIVLWIFYDPFKNCCKKPSQRLTIHLLPMEIVLLLIFAQYHFTIAAITIILLVALAVSLYILARTANKNSDVAHQRNKRSRRAVVCFVLTVSPFLLAITTIGGVYYSVANIPLIRPSLQSSNEFIQENNSLVMAHIDNVTQFDDAAWDKLGLNKRIDLLQTVLNIETTYLGMHPVTIVSNKLDNNTLGQYSHDSKIIDIDFERLTSASPEECLKTLLHEVRHAYQYYVVEMLDWNSTDVQTEYFYKEARRWKFELENYISGRDCFETYYNQSIEWDARMYAEIEYITYKQYIDGHFCDDN